MAQGRDRSSSTEEMLSRLDGVRLGEGLDYESIGRMVVASLLSRGGGGGQGQDPVKIQGAVQIALRQQPAGSAERFPEICCLCYRDQWDVWNCSGSCCPDDDWIH